VVSMDQSAPVFGATVEDRAELAGLLAWPKMTSRRVFPRRWPAPGRVT